MNKEKDTVRINLSGLPANTLLKFPTIPSGVKPMSRFAVLGVYPAERRPKFDVTRYIANFGHRLMQAFRGR